MWNNLLYKVQLVDIYQYTVEISKLPIVAKIL